MLYGWRDKDRVFVGAADTLDELVAFYDSCPSVGELPLIDPLLGNVAVFAIIVRYFDFPSKDRADQFVKNIPVNLLDRIDIAKRQIELVGRDGQHYPLTRELTLRETLGAVDYEAEFAVEQVDAGSEERHKMAQSIRRAERDVEEFGRVRVEENRSDLPRSKDLDAKTAREFFRFSVDASLEQIEHDWSNEDRTYVEMASAYAFDAGKTWFTFVVRGSALRWKSRLEARGFVTSHVERVDAKGQSAVTAPPELRPWTDQAAWNNLSSADKEKRLTKVVPSEFLFAHTANGMPDDQTWVAIAPDSYFLKEGELFPYPLHISHLLPDDFTERDPGLYSTARDWKSIQRDLNRKKFQVSMAFTILANRL